MAKGGVYETQWGPVVCVALFFCFAECKKNVIDFEHVRSERGVCVCVTVGDIYIVWISFNVFIHRLFSHQFQMWGIADNKWWTNSNGQLM